MAHQTDPTPEAKTSIDSLLELLKEKGKVDLNTVSITPGSKPDDNRGMGEGPGERQADSGKLRGREDVPGAPQRGRGAGEEHQR